MVFLKRTRIRHKLSILSGLRNKILNLKFGIIFNTLFRDSLRKFKIFDGRGNHKLLLIFEDFSLLDSKGKSMY